MLLRAFHGVNLSGWLTLESWVTPELFADSGALDEPSLIASLGRKRYRQLVERHRDSFMSQADFTQIASRGFNAVRLPVPLTCVSCGSCFAGRAFTTEPPGKPHIVLTLTILSRAGEPLSSPRFRPRTVLTNRLVSWEAVTGCSSLFG